MWYVVGTNRCYKHSLTCMKIESNAIEYKSRHTIQCNSFFVTARQLTVSPASVAIVAHPSDLSH